MSIAESIEYFYKFCEDLDAALEKAGIDMSVAEDRDEELRETKYPHLRLLTGGKGPPDGPVDNWLAEYEEGTTFVARHRNSNEVDYNLYHVLFKSLPKVVLLKWQLPDGKMLDYYVDPVRFSRLFPEHVILGVVKQVTEGDAKQEPQKEVEVQHDRQPDSDA